MEGILSQPISNSVIGKRVRLVSKTSAELTVHRVDVKRRRLLAKTPWAATIYCQALQSCVTLKIRSEVQGFIEDDDAWALGVDRRNSLVQNAVKTWLAFKTLVDEDGSPPNRLEIMDAPPSTGQPPAATTARRTPALDGQHCGIMKDVADALSSWHSHIEKECKPGFAVGAVAVARELCGLLASSPAPRDPVRSRHCSAAALQALPFLVALGSDEEQALVEAREQEGLIRRLRRADAFAWKLARKHAQGATAAELRVFEHAMRHGVMMAEDEMSSKMGRLLRQVMEDLELSLKIDRARAAALADASRKARRMLGKASEAWGVPPAPWGLSTVLGHLAGPLAARLAACRPPRGPKGRESLYQETRALAMRLLEEDVGDDTVAFALYRDEASRSSAVDRMRAGVGLAHMLLATAAATCHEEAMAGRDLGPWWGVSELLLQLRRTLAGRDGRSQLQHLRAGDWARLSEGQCLTNAMLDFFIRLGLRSVPDSRSYALSSCFFSRLTSRGAANGVEGWEHVSTWTRGARQASPKGIFAFDHVFVPVSFGARQWMLAVICHPWNAEVSSQEAAIDRPTPGIAFLEPIGGSVSRSARVMHFLRDYLKREWADCFGDPSSFDAGCLQGVRVRVQRRSVVDSGPAVVELVLQLLRQPEALATLMTSQCPLAYANPQDVRRRLRCIGEASRALPDGPLAGFRAGSGRLLQDSEA